MSRADWTALFLSLAAVFAAYLVGDRIFERMAHIEDEMAYGRLRRFQWKTHLPMPPEPESFDLAFSRMAGQRSANIRWLAGCAFWECAWACW
jgi:hypothetical protein